LAALGHLSASAGRSQTADLIGVENSGRIRIENGQENQLSVSELQRRGSSIFGGEWKKQEGGGRPMSTGTGAPIVNPSRPLVFPNNFNRLSAMDSNNCGSCHILPHGILGGAGDFAQGVFMGAQRFDSVTFDHTGDPTPLSGAFDDQGKPMTLAKIGNYRIPPGLFGSGYIEMLSRQMTAELQTIRDSLDVGQQAPLTAKGVSFGVLKRTAQGYDISQVTGLPPQSVLGDVPSLVLQPFQQSGSSVSLRQVANNAFNHHHGIQSQERFGAGVDPDGDGFVDELRVAEITAAVIFQATMAVPSQVLPEDPVVRQAIARGEEKFEAIGCTNCHVKALPLTEGGWIYTEPNPYNLPGNLQLGEAPTVSVDLTSNSLPGPRLSPGPDGILWVPAYTDLKLHDITTGALDDPNREPLDINYEGTSPKFHAGNSRFITKKLWGVGNQRPYFHHGRYATLREATLAHFGEANQVRQAFIALSPADQNAVIEFLKSLQVLPPNTRADDDFDTHRRTQRIPGQRD
jgi:hypothetical protein